MKYLLLFALFLPLILLSACSSKPGPDIVDPSPTDTVFTDTDSLPPPYASPSSVNPSNVVGWPTGALPVAQPGFTVKKFAGGLSNPRGIYVAPNGDIFVAEANTNVNISANRISLFRDTNHDGVADSKTVFLQNLRQPLGMLVLGNDFYVACTDGVIRYPYQAGQTVMTATGQKILDLPANGYNNHWTRNIISNASGNKLYVSVGSASNAGEMGMAAEARRANILEVNLDGSGEKVYASGIRNPVGMDWAPGTNTLWTAVNERDELGDDLVPDYITSVKEGGFYGWPYTYWGKYVDPRWAEEGPQYLSTSIKPDLGIGAHTASLGLAFDHAGLFPGEYKGGAFIGQHGSWNRSELSGYKVIFVPFVQGKPSGKPRDFLTGFRVAGATGDVYGRPVGVAFTPQYMLVADDAGNTIFSVLP